MKSMQNKDALKRLAKLPKDEQQKVIALAKVKRRKKALAGKQPGQN